MLTDLFKTPKRLTPKQKNWLKMVSGLPDIKEIMNDQVKPEDAELANEAKELLAKYEEK